MKFIPTVTLALALYSAAHAADPAPIAFDSFTYIGRDDAFNTSITKDYYLNPILAGYYPDPSICRVGDDYYLINSSFAHFPGIPIHHSRDLVNWTQLGHVIDRPTQLKYYGLGISRGIFAPAISHHNGVFYIVCTMVDAGGNFLVTATNPAGPWSDPVWFNFEGIDPSLFFADDGRAWMVNNGGPVGAPLYQGHRAIWIQQFDIAAKKLIGPRQVIVNGGVDISQKPVWIEGPHLYQRDGWYYLSCAEGGTGDNHSQVILRSKAPTGPFVPWDKNPILTQRDLDGTVPQAVTTTGHADLVIGPDGNWWSVFLACRPFAGNFYATGRETFLLPVKWTADGWPQILPPGERVPYVVKAPGRANPPDEPSPEAARQRRLALPIPLSGNFTWTDEFDSAALSPLWLMLRTPKETWWNLTDGQLRLTPRAALLSGKDNPSFFGRRLQHAKFEASARLQVPTAVGTSAGLVAFQNETHHYYFAVRRTTGGLSAVVEKWNGSQAETLITALLPETKVIELRLTGDDKILSFAYALKPGEWHIVVPAADATVITTQAAGGFVGALVGVHARLEP